MWTICQDCVCIFVRPLLIFPKGNNMDHLSVNLDAADSSSLPHGWSRYAQFSLAVVNQVHNKFTVKKDLLDECFNAMNKGPTRKALDHEGGIPNVMASLSKTVQFIKKSTLPLAITAFTTSSRCNSTLELVNY
ncbi:hypothetical protein L1987_74812 [Smallanthus sonchifolius]|uniref:Uncharacterized protein n=1 Tax=Smallanthus sonchifolius TaxID=185202 RepID=A0ACB9A2Z5_9ASTR|nr:hypothetical protein L1987_74812 [Smallanthus sonchifolius]